MKLSIVIPAHNEEGSIVETLDGIVGALSAEQIEYEVLVVDDASTDQTASVVAGISERNPCIRAVSSPYRNGYGFAVRAGLERYTGDAVAVMMADGSDSPEDLVAYHRVLVAGYDCAFGSRFMPGGHVYDYPRFKLVLNRIVNMGIRGVFGHGYDDTTNAFKAYRREVIDSIQPLISQHFNLTVEMPLKAVVRGCSYAVIPISWCNRRTGTSKLRLQEMGSRYLFIVLYVFFEHHLSRGDYRRQHRARGGHSWRAGVPSAVIRAEERPADPTANDGSDVRAGEPEADVG
ncbi:MAG: glycosyltransferase family 2 protein [Solirubrobacteraceae bacterium]|jgi:dolichol-phosphate mannosyltransferase